jgi:putative acetyltransferase
MLNLNVTTRQARRSDLPEILKLFVEAVKAICAKDYSPEQIKAWTLSIDDTERWITKLEQQYFVIAEANNKIKGYASLEKMNHLDLLYVSKDHQRLGIASKLYDNIEMEAIRRGATSVESDVSITAKPFFEAKGFKTITMQKIKITDVEIINYKMIKELN